MLGKSEEITKMSKKRETTICENKLYQGRVLTFYVNEVECPNGNKATREMVTHPGGVCILPVLGDKIIFENQFRYPYDKDILELPAGKLEKKEDPYQAALRELEEETGYRTDNLISLGEMYPSVGYTNEVIHLYAAENLVKSNQHLDEDEFIDLLLIDKEKAFEMAKNGQIQDAKTLICILKYFNMR